MLYCNTPYRLCQGIDTKVPHYATPFEACKKCSECRAKDGYKPATVDAIIPASTLQAHPETAAEIAAQVEKFMAARAANPRD